MIPKATDWTPVIDNPSIRFDLDKLTTAELEAELAARGLTDEQVQKIEQQFADVAKRADARKRVAGYFRLAVRIAALPLTGAPLPPMPAGGDQ